MKIALLNIYTENIKQLAVITTEYNKRKYCEKNGYDLLVKTKDFSYKDFGFEKIKFVLDTVKSNKYDWILWVGSDTMITNYNIKVEHLIDEEKSFIIANDVWDFNSDVFLIKNHPRSIEYFEEILSLHDKYIDENGKPRDLGVRLPDGGARCWAEQEAMIDLKEKYKDAIKIVPQKILNSYLYHLYPSPWHQKGLDCEGYDGRWSEGDFIVHWPGMNNELRLNLAVNFIPKVKGDE